jgi:signal transduction histidine kinase/Tfp pilus assembly protein PilF
VNDASLKDSFALTPHQRIESLIVQAREALGVDSAVALDLSSRAYAMAIGCNDLSGQAAALLEMGRADHRLGRLDLALESMLHAARHFETLKNTVANCEALTIIGQVYRELGELNLAAQKYREVLSLSRSFRQPKDEASALNGIAGIEYQHGHYEEALEYMVEALGVYRHFEDQTGEAACRSNLGMLHTQLGNYPEALEHLLGAYSLTHRFVHDARSEGNCLINIGRLYEQLHEPANARDHYQKALSIGRKAGERMVEVIATINLGTVYHSLNESESALEMFQAGLEVAREMGFRREEIAALDGLAQLYGEAGQPVKAREAHHRSIQIAREIGDRDQEIDTLLSLGKMYLRVDDHDNALRSLQEALNLALESHRKPAALESHLCLVNTYEHYGDYRKALEHHREYHRLEREIQGEKAEQKVKKLAARLELEQARNEAEVLRLQSAVAEQARDAAEQANRAKSDFLSRMSHELRTPLNAVMGFAQLLSVAKLEPKHRQSAERIFRAGEYLLKLVNEVLDIAQVEAGKMTMTIEPISLQSAILDSMELVKPLAKDRSIVLHSSVSEELMVAADRHRLDQVLLNLVSNAIKYNVDGGGVEIYCDAIINDKVRVWVTDTGKGITPDQAGRLFKPFERLGAERSSIPGAGLGLAIVKQLLEAMGGDIGVESIPDRGGRFWFEIMLADVLYIDPRAKKIVDTDFSLGLNQSTKAPSAPFLKPDIGNETPVIVDIFPKLEPTKNLTSDNSSAVQTAKIVCLEPVLGSLKLLEMIVSQRPNTKLIDASTPADLVRLTLQHLPNLVFISDQLGDAKIFSTLQELQKNLKTKAVPVAILSASAKNENDFLAAGAWRCIRKPFDVSTILATLNDALEVRE